MWKLVPETKGRTLEQMEKLWLKAGQKIKLASGPRTSMTLGEFSQQNIPLDET
jgi:hypothetical protein